MDEARPSSHYAFFARRAWSSCLQRFPPKQKTKVAFDSSLTIIAVIISFILFRELQGVREGTVIAAVVVGMAVRFYKKNFGGIEKIVMS